MINRSRCPCQPTICQPPPPPRHHSFSRINLEDHPSAVLQCTAIVLPSFPRPSVPFSHRTTSKYFETVVTIILLRPLLEAATWLFCVCSVSRNLDILARKRKGNIKAQPEPPEAEPEGEPLSTVKILFPFCVANGHRYQPAPERSAERSIDRY